MKTSILSVAALTAAILASFSCSRFEAGSVKAEDELSGETVNWTVSVPVASATKVSSVGDEDTIGNLQVYVFRKSDGALEAYGRAEASSVQLSTTLGEKYVAAVVNAPAFTVTSKAELEAEVSDLAENGVQNLVMFGMDTFTVVGNGTTTVPVTRLVAKVCIGKITNGLTLADYQDSPISITRIFLENVAGDCLYTMGGYPVTKWYNRGAFDADADCSAILSETFTGKSVAYGSSLEESHSFYCYANSATSSDEDCTRLVVEAVIGGKTSYFPLSIGAIEPNHVYTISNVTITRIGSDDPDTPVESGTATFTVAVKPWEVVAPVDFTI